VFDASLVYQHLALSRSQPVNLQLWQVVNLVGAPLAAVLLLPPVVADLERWWHGRGEAERDRPRPKTRPKDS
jgi:hypothetical protein